MVHIIDLLIFRNGLKLVSVIIILQFPLLINIDEELGDLFVYKLLGVDMLPSIIFDYGALERVFTQIDVFFDLLLRGFLSVVKFIRGLGVVLRVPVI